MRIPKGELTPALRREIETLHAMAVGGREAGSRTRYSLHAKNAMIWGGWSAVLAVLASGVFMAENTGAFSAEVALGILLAFALIAFPVALYARRFAGYTPEELRAYLQSLTLSSPERLFAGTLALCYESDNPFLRDEALPALRALCAEWERLDGIAARLASVGPREGEIEGLRARLVRTEDPLACEALAQSLATAERRAAASLGERAAGGGRASGGAPGDDRAIGPRDRGGRRALARRCARRRT